MKILHLLFDDYPYINDWGYQENKLIKYQMIDNEVVVVAGNYVPKVLEGFVKKSDLKEYENFYNQKNKLKIYRLKPLFGQTTIGKKLKFYCNLNKILLQESPDFIFVHDLHALSLYSLANFVRKRDIRCVADVHVNSVNSGTSLISKMLHKYFYRFIIKSNLDVFRKIYYLNENSKDFIYRYYKIDSRTNNLEFLPLGGELLDIKTKAEIQRQFKAKNNISADSILLFHSGKMNELKRTIEIINSFNVVNDRNLELFLIGTPSESIKEDFFKKISENSNIHYLGWKSNKELIKYLSICDIYLQPGSPSVTAHEAMCNGCAVVLSEENGFYTQFIDNTEAIFVSNENNSMINFFNKLKDGELDIENYKKKGFILAEKLFDYKKQSESILNE